MVRHNSKQKFVYNINNLTKIKAGIRLNTTYLTDFRCMLY